MHAYVFPGQGSQFTGMGKELYESSSLAKTVFEQANEIIGFNLTELMFTGSDEDLKQTRVTQPAIFVHSVAAVISLGNDFKPGMVAGHSLGEFSALVANKTLSFESAMKLVIERALAMQQACEINPSAMAAVLGLADEKVEEICGQINDVVVAANYNCPSQLVISGSNDGIDLACKLLTEAGAKRALKLPVGGAFHSPLMEPARERLARAIELTQFAKPVCPVYQNVDAKPHMDADEIKLNLVAQLTAPVRWTQTIQQMIGDGATAFSEIGPGKVLQGLIKKIDKNAIII